MNDRHLKGILAAALVLCALAALARPAAASSSITAGGFASYPVSVRGSAMGGVGVVMTRGSGTAYHNPARLGLVEKRTVGLSYADLSSLGLVRNVYLDYTQPDHGYGATGLYWNWRGTEVESADGMRELGYAENTLCYALGKRIGEYVSIGAAVKGYFVTTDIPDTGGKGGGLDLGLFITPDPWTEVGLVVRNALSTVSWDTGLSDNLPLEVEAGVSYLILDGFVAAAQLRFENSHYAALGIGAEYEIVPQMFSVRGGATDRFDRTYPTFGFGFDHPVFRVDYAAEIDSGDSGLGTTHRIAMSFDF